MRQSPLPLGPVRVSFTEKVHPTFISTFDCPLQRRVCPNSTSSRADLLLPPSKLKLYDVSDASTATVTLQLPSAGTVMGEGGVITAPGGSPERAMDSPGTPRPQILAGVEPPLQGSLEASTMPEAKTQLLGPQGAGVQARAP